MKLVLLSNTINNTNESILRDIKYMLKDIDSVVYIPSAFDRYHSAYDSYVVPFLKQMGISKIEYCGLEDEDYDKSIYEKISNAKAILLGGGNTFHYLYWLRKRNLIDTFKNLSDDKIIIGVSAGVLLLTPNISLSGDQNTALPAIDSFDSIGLTKFYIKPHFIDTLENRTKIKSFYKSLSKERVFPIYGIPEDGGIIVEDNKLIKYGRIKPYYEVYINKKDRFYI